MNPQEWMKKKDMAQLHAFVPRALKRQLFSALALEEKPYSAWVREQATAWLQARAQKGDTA